MTGLEITVLIIRQFAFVALYFIISFGPGVVLGLIIANKVYAKGNPTHMQSQKEDIAKAAKHNAQWNPTHPRWQ
jgi:hypothetical protein